MAPYVNGRHLMESVPPADLSLVIEALASRLDRELARLSGKAPAHTEIVGGWAKIGGLLDALLRVGFTRLCGEHGVSTDALFGHLSGREAWSIAKASAGQLRVALSLAGRQYATRDPSLWRLIAGASDDAGPLARAIAMRNDVVHGRADLGAATQHACLATLRRWLATLHA